MSRAAKRGASLIALAFVLVAVPFGLGLSGTLGVIGMSVGLIALRRRE